jgi:TRAF3-interacting protein 1
VAKVEPKLAAKEEEARGPRSSRPSTARRRPPKLKENVQEGKTGGAAQPVRGIMTEGVDDDDEDEEEDTSDVLGGGQLDGDGMDRRIVVDKAQAGKLVRDIMDDEEQRSKKNEGKVSSLDDLDNGAKTGSIRMGKIGRKEKKKRGTGSSGRPESGSSAGGKTSSGLELSNDELDELRRAIQTISQSTHPLSKCMDFVHDDVALMNEEAEEWHKMYRDKIGSMEAVSCIFF